MRRVFAFFLICTATICATTAAMMIWQDNALEQCYRSLSLSAVSDTHKATDNPGISWDTLRNQNDEVVGWLSVNGTSIDYPVVQTRGDTPADFYLNHDFWRKPNGNGCLYLDNRSTPEGEHLMVFGHQTGFSNRMFSPLRQAWNDDVFRAVGEASWKTPERTDIFIPICALKVDEDFNLIQRFSFDDDAEMQRWLNNLVQEASARAIDAESLVARAKRTLTLVTCASTVPETRERTLVLFVSSG